MKLRDVAKGLRCSNQAQQLIDEHGWEGALLMVDKLLDRAEHGSGYWDSDSDTCLFLREVKRMIEEAE